jgi:hypothetical protein
MYVVLTQYPFHLLKVGKVDRIIDSTIISQGTFLWVYSTLTHSSKFLIQLRLF